MAETKDNKQDERFVSTGKGITITKPKTPQRDKKINKGGK